MKTYLTDKQGNVWCVKDYGSTVSAYTGGRRALTGMDRATYKNWFMKKVIGKEKRIMNNEWIMCKDELPKGKTEIKDEEEIGPYEESDKVLVCVKDYDGDTYFGIATFNRSHKNNGECWWIGTLEDGCDFCVDPDDDEIETEVIAWMPLHAPKKGEANGH